MCELLVFNRKISYISTLDHIYSFFILGGGSEILYKIFRGGVRDFAQKIKGGFTDFAQKSGGGSQILHD